MKYRPSLSPVAKAIALTTVIGGLVLSGCGAPTPPSSSTSGSASITVTDDLGRTITLPGPVTKAVVANRYNSELIRAMGSIDKVISVDTNTAQDRVYWKQFDPANVIGKGQSDLNYEKIIALKPQVLITPRNGKVEADAEKLKAAGIQVVAVTGWDNAALPKQLDILGKLFGNEAGAKKVTEFYQKNMDFVASRVKDIPTKKTIYWEYGDPFTTCIPGTSNDGWHNMLVSAGGVNIFGDKALAGKDIDPEKILKSDPDLIIKTTSGRALKNTGVYTAPDPAEQKAIADEMLARPGWRDLKATKNGDFYLTTGFIAGGIGKMIGTVYTAKWLYPDKFTDLNPDAIFAEWMKMQDAAPVDGHNYHVPKVG